MKAGTKLNKGDVCVVVPMEQWVDREALLKICRKFHKEMETHGASGLGGDIEALTVKIEKKEGLT